MPRAMRLKVLQVLLMLPIDVLRHSFASHLSRHELAKLRLTNKQALQLVNDCTTSLFLDFHCLVTPVPELVTCVQRFNYLAKLTVYQSQLEASSHAVSYFCEFLYKCRSQLKSVTDVTFSYMPITYALNVSMQVTFPNLQSLTLMDHCWFETASALFEPLASLNRLNIGTATLSLHDIRDASASLRLLTNLQTLSLCDSSMYFLEAAAGCTVRHVCIHALDDYLIMVLAGLPCLEGLKICGPIEYITPARNQLTALKQLKLQNEDNSLYMLSDLLTQPLLESVEWEADEYLIIHINSSVEGLAFLHGAWPNQVGDTVERLRQLCPNDSLRAICLDGEDAQPDEVARFISAFSTLPECVTLVLRNANMALEDLRGLATKLPNVTNMMWVDCQSIGDALLEAVPDFQELLTFEIHGGTDVSGMGVAMLPLMVGKRMIQIDVSASLIQGMANVNWVNGILSRGGACSFFSSP